MEPPCRRGRRLRGPDGPGFFATWPKVIATWQLRPRTWPKVIATWQDLSRTWQDRSRTWQLRPRTWPKAIATWQLRSRTWQDFSRPGSFDHEPGSFDHEPGSFDHEPGSFDHEPGRRGSRPGRIFRDLAGVDRDVPGFFATWPESIATWQDRFRSRQPLSPPGRRAPAPARITLRLGEGELFARSRYIAWAVLKERTFGKDALLCPRCESKMRVVATITDPATVRRILEHLGLQSALATEAGGVDAPSPGAQPPSVAGSSASMASTQPPSSVSSLSRSSFSAL